jgi:hypothetical protein
MNSAIRNAGRIAQDLSSWGTDIPPIFASSAAFSYDPGIERARSELLAAIKYLAQTPITWSEREPAVPIERLSAETAMAFIRCMPGDRAFPKLALDGEGGLMFVWDSQERKAMITVDRAFLLLVTKPGEPASYHFNPLRFDGETIPSIIIESLPRR